MRALLFVLLPLLPAGPLLAHHGWSQYDPDETVTVNGLVTEVEFVNPHVMIKVESEGKTWLVVLPPIYGMQTRGLPGGALKPGMTVLLVGHPHRTDPSEMRAERITLDGKTVELR
jgi:hypothetical protein